MVPPPIDKQVVLTPEQVMLNAEQEAQKVVRRKFESLIPQPPPPEVREKWTSELSPEERERIFADLDAEANVVAESREPAPNGSGKHLLGLHLFQLFAKILSMAGLDRDHVDATLVSRVGHAIRVLDCDEVAPLVEVDKNLSQALVAFIDNASDVLDAGVKESSEKVLAMKVANEFLAVLESRGYHTLVAKIREARRGEDSVTPLYSALREVDSATKRTYRGVEMLALIVMVRRRKYRGSQGQMELKVPWEEILGGYLRALGLPGPPRK
jgi:hypothetical protein